MNVENLQTNRRMAVKRASQRKSFKQWFIKGGISFLARVLLKLSFEGTEHIPKEGGILIATNHMSLIDTAILLLAPVRKDLAAVVTDKYKKHIIISFLVNAMPHIWIDRTRADFAAFGAAVDYLKKGGALGIAPEGTRSKVGALIEGKPGAVLIAMKSGVPIIPVGITGTENFVANLRRLRRTTVVARYGPAFVLPPIDNEKRSVALQHYTDEVMCRIAAQLPAKNHGFYADHPRLKELLS